MKGAAPVRSPSLCLCVSVVRNPASAAGREADEDAFAHAPVGDAQAADRPGAADRLEDGAAGDDEVGALDPDAGVPGAVGEPERGEPARDRGDRVEGEI